MGNPLVTSTDVAKLPLMSALFAGAADDDGVVVVWIDQNQAP